MTQTIEQTTDHSTSTVTATKVKLRKVMGIEHSLLTKPEQVPLKLLRVDPVRFQIRNHDANTYVKKRIQGNHSAEAVHALQEIITAGNELDPVIVWKDLEDTSGGLWVIDGHHRMEAYGNLKVDPSELVWIQRFCEHSEGEARKFALSLNSRTHVNMTKDECQHALWILLLSEEVQGSVRALERDFGVSKSAVHRMQQQVAGARKELEAEALSDGQPFNTAWIRQNAKLWKEYAPWRDDSEKLRQDLHQPTVEMFLKKLTDHFSVAVLKHPDEFQAAVEEFIDELGVGTSPRFSGTEQNDDF